MTWRACSAVASSRLRSGPSPSLSGGDDLLADAVERRVGHLRELLGEVVEEQPGAVAEHGDRGVRAHGAERLRAVLRHRADEDPHLLLGVPEGALAAGDGCRRVHDVLALGQVLEVDAALVEPLAPGLRRRELGLDLVVLDDAAGLGVDEEHLARAQATLAHDSARLDLQHADLARQHDESIVGDEVATGAQAVAVEGGADERSVGEDEGGRAVPRLHEHRVVLVEVAANRVDVELVLVGLRHHHHHGVRQAAPGEVEELDDLVEGGRVARAAGDDRQHGRQVAEQLGLELGLPGAHPVAVALHGVDLAVVRDHAERLGQRPGGEGVRRVARVHQRETRRETLVGEVRIERFELESRDHALVDEGARTQRREVRLELPLGPLAQPERLAVERDALHRAIGRRACTRQEQLLEERHRLAGERAQAVGTHGHDAPAEHLEALVCGEGGDAALDRLALLDIRGQEGRADHVAADGRQREFDDGTQERVRDLRDDAGTVAGSRVGPDGTAVLEVAQRVERQVDDVVPGRAAQCRDHGEAAGILLAGRVVHADRGGCRAESSEGWRESHSGTVLTRVWSVWDYGGPGNGGGGQSGRACYFVPAPLVTDRVANTDPELVVSARASLPSAVSV